MQAKLLACCYGFMSQFVTSADIILLKFNTRRTANNSFRNQVGVICVKKLLGLTCTSRNKVMLMMTSPWLRYFWFHSIYSLAASCSLQSAVCSLQSAVCSLRSAVCGLQSAVCGLQSAVCSLQSVVCGLQSAVCSLRSANVIHRFTKTVVPSTALLYPAYKNK